MSNSEVTLVGSISFDRHGNKIRRIYPTTSTPNAYLLETPRFHALEHDFFEHYHTDNGPAFLKFCIRGVPVSGPNRADDRLAQKELASTVRNLLRFKLGGVPNWFLGCPWLKVRAYYAFPDVNGFERHPGMVPFSDTLQEFLFDCLKKIKLFDNGSDFEDCRAIKRVTHQPEQSETYALRESGGYFVSIERWR